MNKQELVTELSTQTGLSEKDCTLVVNSLTSTIIDQLSQQQDVKLVGFGTFSTRESKGRLGRNPKTGEAVNIPNKIVAKFRAGKLLKTTILENNSI